MQTTLEKIWKETEGLTLEEQSELVERLVHQLREKGLIKREYLEWNKLYGLGKGLWENEDAQEYISRSREDRE
ncbi:hypothetical protein M1N52_04170 [Thermodesulfovibrionales bacterium]|nr:hypothetical protein [Thermodesulfovibrionales bacterium]MCL0083525.1 hypothetical protein [Thermodesulfovibrionales bacterium]MCL0085656.1 hypothetical protein [Thermodesulfovibrionales bacterium]MCL0086432.1 hypothetical protein [Thermodesulfovibrionales bacterium]MCL0086913.1 hypothetical protein [Thermodesulfovibrionales bacterium]